MSRFVEKVVTGSFNTIVGKRLALFGFAFKANTGDTRESPAITVTRRLLNERASVVVTDPKAIPEAKHDLADVIDQVEFCEDPYEAAKGAHAICVMTEWDLYKDLD